MEALNLWVAAAREEKSDKRGSLAHFLEMNVRGQFHNIIYNEEELLLVRLQGLRGRSCTLECEPKLYFWVC